MAYRFFGSELLDEQLPGSTETDARASSILRQPFSRIERIVIALAMRSPRSIEASRDTWLFRAARLLFGIEQHAPLANPRLEALRRYTALARHHPQSVTPQEEQRFVAAGFSAMQARLISRDLLAAHEWHGVPGQA